MNPVDHDTYMLETIVKELVEFPDAVKVTRTVDEMGVFLVLDINRGDMGKVIGREGGMINAIRMVMRGIGMRHNARVNVRINEPEGEPHPNARV